MIIDRAFLEVFSLYAELDNGEITWGKLNREGERFRSRLEYRIEMWKNKVLSKTAEIANIVAKEIGDDVKIEFSNLVSANEPRIKHMNYNTGSIRSIFPKIKFIC